MGRRPRYRTQIDGLIVVDKPVGLSSMDVVRRVRNAAGFCKTGHGGTLDPLASGVVICALGKATKRIEALMRASKVYEAWVDLSAFTTTDDLEGERTEAGFPTRLAPDRLSVAGACAAMVGTIHQTPPAHSAVHVDGRRAYELARAGQAVSLDSRQVIINRIELLDYAWPKAHLCVHCGKGVYIRSLARDLGRALAVGGHLTALRRTAVGPYALENAISIDRLNHPITEADLLPIPSAPAGH